MKRALAAIAAFLLTITLLTLAGLANPSSAQTTALRCFGLQPTHIGSSGADTIVGTRKTDVIWAGGGNDLIIGKGGSDVICGGPGNDRIRSGAGNDLISGGPGNDRCNGGRGAGDFAADCEKTQRIEKDHRPAKTPTPATTTTTTTTTTQPPAPSDAQLAQGWIDQLAVVDNPAPGNRYDRDQFGGWKDLDDDCQNTRDEVLIAEAVGPLTFDSDSKPCDVLSGNWIDPWSGEPTPRNAPDTQIDHLVSLSDAHTSGAWQWANSTKSAFSNDELNLNATDGAVNGAKSNKTADKWQPPLRAARCGFAIDYARVKLRWKLSVTTAEKQALVSLVDSCSEPWSNGPRSETAGVLPGQPNREIAEVPPTAPPTSEPPTAASTTVSYCLAQDERVGIHNQSGSAIDLGGWILHDFERRNEISLPSYTLLPGETVVVKSGPTHESGPGIDWTGRHVWNNDGDTAFLIPPGASEPLAGVVCSQTR